MPPRCMNQIEYYHVLIVIHQPKGHIWIICSCHINPTQKGKTFKNKRVMKVVIKKYVLDNKFTAKIIYSSKIRFEVECSNVTWSFVLCAMRGKGTLLW